MNKTSSLRLPLCENGCDNSICVSGYKEMIVFSSWANDKNTFLAGGHLFNIIVHGDKYIILRDGSINRLCGIELTKNGRECVVK